jgi:hypothetical protein
MGFPLPETRTLTGQFGVTVISGAKPTLSSEAPPLARSLMRSKPALSLYLFSCTHLFLPLTAKASTNRERRSLSVGFAPDITVTPYRHELCSLVPNIERRGDGATHK